MRVVTPPEIEQTTSADDSQPFASLAEREAVFLVRPCRTMAPSQALFGDMSHSISAMPLFKALCRWVVCIGGSSPFITLPYHSRQEERAYWSLMEGVRKLTTSTLAGNGFYMLPRLGSRTKQSSGSLVLGVWGGVLTIAAMLKHC